MGDDGDSSEANLNAKDGDVARVASERTDVATDWMRSQVVVPYVEDRVTFAPPLLQLGHPLVHSVGLRAVDGNDSVGRLPLPNVQSCLPSGGVPTISLFDGRNSLSSVDARLSLPSVDAQVSFPLADIQPSTMPTLTGVSISLPLRESGNCVHDKTIAPNIGGGSQASLPTMDGKVIVNRLDDCCISLARPDGKERVLDPKILFDGVRGEYLPS